MVFEDRVSAYPNTYAMTDENGNVSRVLLERADEPVIPGTPLNAETFNKMAEDIKSGMAPAGFGLGGYGERIDISSIAELDNIKANGWYALNLENVSADFGGMDVSTATMRVDAYGGNVCRQTLYPYGSYPASIVRNKYLSAPNLTPTWSPWCVENPPMYPGEEYRTTERSEGKPVYAKRIAYTTTESLGSDTSATDTTIAHGITNFNYLVRCSGRNRNYSLPMLTMSGGSVSINQVNTSEIVLRNYKETTAPTTFYFDLYYTKTT